MNYRILQSFDPADLKRMATGYVSDAVYRATKSETPNGLTISLQLEPLTAPYVKHMDATEDLHESYARWVSRGCSMGAYVGGRLVGIALADRQVWNGVLWIWEFHVDPAYRRQGVGRGLMAAMVNLARQKAVRCITLEVQNTNVPAIRFYRSVGFEMDAVDLSYYTNTDATDGEVAIFMKHKL